MIIEIHLKNYSIGAFEIDRNYVNPDNHKFAISINPSHLHKSNDLSKKHKLEFKKIIKGFSYSNDNFATTNNFSSLMHVHPSYFNNISKEIPVESFVRSPQASLLVKRED